MQLNSLGSNKRYAGRWLVYGAAGIAGGSRRRRRRRRRRRKGRVGAAVDAMHYGNKNHGNHMLVQTLKLSGPLSGK